MKYTSVPYWRPWSDFKSSETHRYLPENSTGAIHNPGRNRGAEPQVTQISEFNTVLNQVLTLTESDDQRVCSLAPESVERHRCEGKLLALHQVIGFFLEIDRRTFGAKA
jgi:hypothetical protein